MADNTNSLQYKIWGPQGLAKLGGALQWSKKTGAGKEEVMYPDIGKSLGVTKAGQKTSQIRNALAKKLGLAFTAPEAIAKFGADIATFLPREAWETGTRAGEIAMSQKMGVGEKLGKEALNVLPMIALAGAGAVGGKLARPIGKAIKLGSYNMSPAIWGKIGRPIGKAGVQLMEQTGLPTAVLKGATAGGMFGGTKAMAEGAMDDKTFREVVANAIKSTGKGAVAGGLLGGAFYGAGKGIAKLKELPKLQPHEKAQLKLLSPTEQTSYNILRKAGIDHAGAKDIATSTKEVISPSDAKDYATGWLRRNRAGTTGITPEVEEYSQAVSKRLPTGNLETVEVTGIRKAPRSSAVGTSFQAYWKTSMDNLKKMFGEPHYGPSADGKVNAEWVFRTKNGPVTIYDYKSGTAPENVTEWHIGGNSKSVQAFLSQLQQKGMDVNKFEVPEYILNQWQNKARPLGMPKAFWESQKGEANLLGDVTSKPKPATSGPQTTSGQAMSGKVAGKPVESKVELSPEQKTETIDIANQLKQVAQQIKASTDPAEKAGLQVKAVQLLATSFKDEATQFVNSIKAKPMTTKGHYGEYMRILGQFPRFYRAGMAVAMQKAGADPEAIASALKLLGD